MLISTLPITARQSCLYLNSSDIHACLTRVCHFCFKSFVSSICKASVILRFLASKGLEPLQLHTSTLCIHKSTVFLSTKHTLGSVQDAHPDSRFKDQVRYQKVQH